MRPHRRISTIWRPTSVCRAITNPTTTRPVSSGACRSGGVARCASDAPAGLDALVGGWSLAAVSSVYAGEPVTFTYTAGTAFQVSGIQQDFRGANIYRPNVVGDPLTPASARTIDNWFNRDAVSLPTDPSQPFGDAPRNSVRGPNFWQVDMALSKSVPLGRSSASFEVRIEAFNLFNRSNFRAPNGNRSAAGFGTITSTYDPRQLQLAARLTF